MTLLISQNTIIGFAFLGALFLAILILIAAIFVFACITSNKGELTFLNTTCEECIQEQAQDYANNLGLLSTTETLGRNINTNNLLTGFVTEINNKCNKSICNKTKTRIK